MPSRRTIIKWLHWSCAITILWFFLVEPDDNRADPGAALSIYAGMGVILGTAVAIWFGMYLIKGAHGRPGPKLKGRFRQAYPWVNTGLYWAVPTLVLSGALAGFAAPFAIRAFGLLPINPAAGSKSLHDLAEEVHEIVFNAVIVLIVVHILYHVWRHFRLKDNALKIMLPRILHRFL